MTYPHSFPSLLVRTLLWEFHGYWIFFPFLLLTLNELDFTAHAISETAAAAIVSIRIIMDYCCLLVDDLDGLYATPTTSNYRTEFF